MPALNSTVDGMGFEEVNQEVTQTTIVSGLNIYATGSLVADRVQGTTEISGLNIYSTSGVQAIWYSGTMVRATDTVEADTVSGGDIRNAQGTIESVAIGSTTVQVFGGYINAGSGTLDGGSGLAVTFGNVAFTTAPHVLCSYVDEPSSVGVVTGSNVTLEGFDAIGDTASKSFNWVAIGV